METYCYPTRQQAHRMQDVPNYWTEDGPGYPRVISTQQAYMRWQRVCERPNGERITVEWPLDHTHLDSDLRQWRHNSPGHNYMAEHIGADAVVFG